MISFAFILDLIRYSTYVLKCNFNKQTNLKTLIVDFTDLIYPTDCNNMNHNLTLSIYRDPVTPERGQLSDQPPRFRSFSQQADLVQLDVFQNNAPVK